jgi:LptA/(LptD N-terminal domain) LPS transport protein
MRQCQNESVEDVIVTAGMARERNVMRTQLSENQNQFSRVRRRVILLVGPSFPRSASFLTTIFSLFLLALLTDDGWGQRPPSTSRSPSQNKARANPGTARANASGTPAGKKPGDLLNDSGSKDAPKGPTEITATQEAQFDMGSRTGVFLGSVKVVDPQFTMTADKLTVHLNKQEDGGGLEQAEADGNVYIVHLNPPKPADNGPATGAPPAPQQPIRSTGKGEHAVYQAKDGSVTLLGWPQVTQGVNTHIAMDPNVKMIIYRDGRLKTYGSTRTVIQDRTEPNKPQANAAQ